MDIFIISQFLLHLSLNNPVYQFISLHSHVNASAEESQDFMGHSTWNLLKIELAFIYVEIQDPTSFVLTKQSQCLKFYFKDVLPPLQYI